MPFPYDSPPGGAMLLPYETPPPEAVYSICKSRPFSLYYS
jgi:hypothetical protein